MYKDCTYVCIKFIHAKSSFLTRYYYLFSEVEPENNDERNNDSENDSSDIDSRNVHVESNADGTANDASKDAGTRLLVLKASKPYSYVVCICALFNIVMDKSIYEICSHADLCLFVQTLNCQNFIGIYRYDIMW